MSSSPLIRRIISSATAGPVGGPYRYAIFLGTPTKRTLLSSQGVLIGQTLYLSGSIGLDPQTGQFAGESVKEQAQQVEEAFDRC